MYIIGLTGGIGSGKGEAAKQFTELGVPVVDTDIIAHSLTAAGEPMLDKIADAFGADFLNADGSLNRAKLRVHIFNNVTERKKLEALLHPAIHQRALQQLSDNQSRLHPDYQILVVPLLFESNSYQTVVHKTLVIDCDEAIQIKRTMARSKMSEAEVKAIIQAQMSRTSRRELANHIIENNGSIAELSEEIHKTHAKFIKNSLKLA